MIDIALVLIVVCAIAAVTFFHNALLPGLIVAFLAGVLVVLRFLLVRGKLVLKKDRLIQGGLIFLLVLSFGFLHIEYEENGFLHYQHKLQEFDKLLEKELPEKAGAVLDEVENSYGADNNHLIYRKIKLAIYMDQYEAAEEYLYEYSHKHLREYYWLLEKVYLNLGKTDALRDMYIAAADANPDWEYAWSKAGIAHLERGNYQAAHYYLRHAYELSGEDGMAAYRLGILYYTVGEDTDSMRYFAEALEKGVSEETKASMVAYLVEMGVGQDED